MMTQVDDAIARVAGMELRKASDKQLVRVTPQHDGTIRIEVKGQETLVFHPRQASLLVRSMAEFHGWKAKFMERAAVEADTKTGRTDAQVKHAKLAELIAHFESGTESWEMARPGAGSGEGKGPNIGLLMRAMQALGKLPADATVDQFNGKLDAQAERLALSRDQVIAQLWKTEAISVKVAELRAADRKTSLVDAEQLLADWE